jgi:serine/threonine protein kinase
VRSQTPTAPSEPAFRVPGYELQEVLGEGGVGVVYRAYQLARRRTVAVKFLHAPAAGGLGHESSLMATLCHPHVVAVYDSGQVDGRPYLVMEHVAGPSLRARMTPGRPWPPRRALPVLAAVASALAYVHGRGILHLDLKPENVLLDERGRVKVSDFGLGRLHPGPGHAEAAGHGQGTLDYCPPEQRFGLAVGPRADVFSLATLAYELLTGRLPGRVYVPCARHAPRLPAGLDAVLARGLARHPEERYPTVEAFWNDLRHPLEAAGRPRLWAWLGAALAGLRGARQWRATGRGT